MFIAFRKKHYKRILAAWPQDALRPSQQHFQRVLQHRLALLSASKTSPSSSSATSSTEIPASTTPTATATTTTTTAPPPKLSPSKQDVHTLNALYSLLDNRYSKKYPAPPHILAPQSKPTYYDDVIRELEEAPRRGWWASFAARWKGRVRFS